jgi:hypothetical protein
VYWQMLCDVAVRALCMHMRVFHVYSHVQV